MGVELAQILLVSVFIVSAFLKLIDLEQFERTIFLLPLVAAGREKMVAYLTIISEIAVAFGLCLGLRIAAFAAIFLLSVFTFVFVLALIRNIYIPCSCFGSADKPFGKLQLFRNICLIIAACLLVVSGMKIVNVKGVAAALGLLIATLSISKLQELAVKKAI